MDVPIRPCPLGKVVVTTAGTPVRLTTGTQIATHTPPPVGNDNKMDDAWARRIDFKNPAASPQGGTAGNTGRIYVGLVDMSKATLVGVVFFIDPGESYTLDNSQQAQPYHLGDYYVDAEVSGEFLTGCFDPS